MKKIKLSSEYKKMLGDIHTPVGMYLRLRDKYPNSILLESSDYHGNEHSYSYICCNPIARFEAQDYKVTTQFPNEEEQITAISQDNTLINQLDAFINTFETDELDLDFVYKGIFGYTGYDSIKYFEDIELKEFESNDRRIPDMLYQVYSIIIVYNHFRDEVCILEHRRDEDERQLDKVISYLENKDFSTFSFTAADDEESNYTDEQFRDMVKKGIEHSQRGDVFQMVLSRQFKRSFEGDEFNVYRALRSINPSPYLFYFDYGDFKIFGSSPEAQIVIKENEARIFPIAGTFKRTGNDKQDFYLARKLFDDPKENSEHVMLVDLARNDLSRHGSEVEVETFKEIQYYSHVIHMVSQVMGKIDEGVTPMQLVADTFPAGTLSGAPKYMAIKLINKYEDRNRGYYGGAIGYIGFDKSFNHAIMIRSILSKKKKMYYQAGAGVVAKSEVESELNEVFNKIGALRSAIKRANDVE